MDTTPSILDAQNCDDVLAALDAGADVLETTADGQNILHIIVLNTEGSGCLENFIAAVDDAALETLLTQKDMEDLTPYAMAFDERGERFSLLTELAASLGIIEELIGEHLHNNESIFSTRWH